MLDALSAQYGIDVDRVSAPEAARGQAAAVDPACA
jgi:hypothetical protein